MSKGLVFISDAAISALCILLILLGAFHALAGKWIEEYVFAHEREKELLAFAISESIVKNHNELNPANGASYLNHEKKRIEANVIDEELLGKIEPRRIGKYYFAGVYEKNAENPLPENEQTGCITIERFVLIKGIFERRSIIGVVVCG